MKAKRLTVIRKIGKDAAPRKKSLAAASSPKPSGHRTASSVAGVPLETCADAAFEQLRPGLHRLVERGVWPGVAACAFVDGKLRLLDEFGHADLESGQPMTSRSLVRLYSMTKCIVAAAVLQLVDSRKLGLDDRLSDHIPGFGKMYVIPEGEDGLPDEAHLEPACRPITIRHLLTHTSGISCGPAVGIDGPKKRNARELAWLGIYNEVVGTADRGEFRNLGAWVSEIAKLPLWNHPGDHYGYGYGYDILGHLVELKTGQQLAKYLRQHIFEPLGMRSTRFDLAGVSPASHLRRHLTVLYRHTKSAKWGSDGKRRSLVRVDPPRRGAASRWSVSCKLPSGGGSLTHLEGGLLSTLDDYSRFLLAVTSGGAHPATGVRVLSKKMAEMMFADQTACLRPRRGAVQSPYDSNGLGLCCLGELLRRNAPCDEKWFDGVAGVRQWGGAASTAFKYDPNNGRPILLIVMTQAFPQDDGFTITEAMQLARKAVSGSA
mmetsp:Transcript_129118/g.248834  ORF Transcript_129118/g.248834 Transcript_129118/m.248834 type:complete len:489 (+) Transcript_129118:63-1529(+)